MKKPTHPALRLALASALGILASDAAWAAPKTPKAAIEAAVPFNIPSQNLANALTAFTQQSHVQVLYEGSIAQGLRSAALQGQHSPVQALQILLQGTPLQSRFTDWRTVTLERKIAPTATPQPESRILPAQESIATLPTVKVTAPAAYDAEPPDNPDYNRPNASSATKTDTPIMETPLNIQVIPQQVLKDQQAYQLDKSLQNVSGVFADTNGSGGGNNMVAIIRGFSTYDTYRNGLRFPSAQSTGTADLANIDRVEVLKGPASMLYGRIEPGGIVNLVPKTPLSTPYYALQQQIGSYSFHRTTADATGPVSQDGSLLYRLNFAYEDAGSFQDFRENKKAFVAPVLRWNIGPRTQATFEFEYKDAQDPVDFGVPAVGDRPAQVSRRFSPNERGNVNDSQSYLAGFNGSHGFNDDWSLRQSFYWVGTDTANRSVAAYAAAGGDIYRYKGTNHLNSDSYFTTLNLSGKFDTLGLNHTLLLGWDYYQIDQKNPVSAAFFTNLKLATPIHGGVEGDLIQRSDYANKEDWYGFYLQDQVKLPYGLQLLAGFRYDNATAENKGNDLLSPASPFYSGDYTHSASNDKITPRVGLLWRPIPEFSLYGNYVENFGAPNLASVTTLGGNNTPLAPQTAQQWEVGMKGELYEGRLTGTLAWFDLAKQNIPARDPVNPLKTILIGEAHNQGLEIDIAGEILPGWRIVAVGAYIDSAITKDSQPDYANVDSNGNPIGTTPGNTGHRLFNVPKFSGTLWNTYEWRDGLLKGLKIGGGVVGRSQTQGDNENTFQLPGYAIANLMAAYPIKVGSGKISLQLNIDNLLDKSYFYSSTGAATAGVHYGTPRTFLGSVRMEF